MKNKQKIKFSCQEGLDLAIPHPCPASKVIPSWYKQMKTGLDQRFINQDNTIQYQSTLKACPPITDYLCSGYVITLPCDIMVSEADRFHWNVPVDLITGHSPKQVQGSPYEGKPAHKLNNPWRIETPKGYSCLFFKPHYCDTKGIDILPAIVDTDVYHEVNFPFFYNGEYGEHYIIPQGTPIAQFVPIKREEWEMEVVPMSNRVNILSSFVPATKFKRMYKNLFHTKKVYR